MARQKLGKLCLSLHFNSICKVNPPLEYQLHLEECGYGDFRHLLNPKLLDPKSHDLNRRSLLLRKLRRDCANIAEKGSRNYPYTLYDDVFPFLECVTKPTWPFSDTVIYVLSQYGWGNRCVKSLGIPLNRTYWYPDGKPSAVHFREGPRLPRERPPLELPITFRDSIGPMKQDLRLLRFHDYEEFRHVNLITTKAHAVESRTFEMPTVMICREPGILQDPEVIDLDHRYFRKPWQDGVQKSERLPRIASLLALRNWTEEHFALMGKFDAEVGEADVQVS